MKVLLIPSATLIAQEMREKVGNIPSILYPLNGKIMLEHILNVYNDYIDKVYVVIYEEKERVKKIVREKVRGGGEQIYLLLN